MKSSLINVLIFATLGAAAIGVGGAMFIKENKKAENVFELRDAHAEKVIGVDLKDTYPGFTTTYTLKLLSGNGAAQTKIALTDIEEGGLEKYLIFECKHEDVSLFKDTVSNLKGYVFDKKLTYGSQDELQFVYTFDEDAPNESINTYTRFSISVSVDKEEGK